MPDNVRIGERSWLYSSFAFLHYESKRGVRVGHDTGLYNGTFFDLGPDGKVEIGNFCTLVGAIICSNNHVKIGDYAFIAHEVVIADSWNAKPMQNDSAQASKSVIEIGENAWIGANAVILKGAKIGQGAIVGAATIVDFDVPDFAVVAGNPAQLRR